VKRFHVQKRKLPLSPVVWYNHRMNPHNPSDFLTRRSFLTRGTHLASAGLLGAALGESPAVGAPSSETLVTQLYSSLNDTQKAAICFPWEHGLRQEVDNNWHITKQPIRDVLNKDQQDLVRQIFDGLHSDEYKSEVWRQFDQDNKGDGGFPSASIGLFGTPGTGKFEFVLTGRHCTRRCDGDSDAGVAFGGPIFYGHAAKSFNESPQHEGNAYWFQAKRANEVFAALDGKQREKALVTRIRKELGSETVELSGKTTGLSGIPLSDLSADQKELFQKVLADLLKPFRKADADEAMKLLEAGGLDNLHMAFSKQSDLGEDQMWDNWQIEGPSAIWVFRGAPHVHCWAHIRDKA
jgi:hypothetical protein